MLTRFPSAQGPPPGQYGAPPPGQYSNQPPYGGGPPQQHYGGPSPPAGGPQETQAYKQALERAVNEKQLHNFFNRHPQALDSIASRASAKVNQICQQWRLPQEVGRDLARLGLYDIIIYVDDSGSMQFEENGERIDDLKLILNRVVQAATLFDDDGISIRFMNTVMPPGMGDHVRSEQQVNDIMRSVKFAGLTPMGRELKKKVIDGIVLQAARQSQLTKPVLVITVTDGQPAGDEPGPTAVFDTVRYAVQEVHKATGSPSGIAFQFAQVGNDVKAREFLGKLDSDATVGSMVDCTSNFEQEQQEMLQQNPPVELTPDLWVIKLLLGSIDPSYDSKDEVRSYRPGSGPAGHAPPQQQGYGAPPGPPGGYGGQGQYGGPPPGQYGGPPPGGQYGHGPPPPGGRPTQPPYPPAGGGGGYGGPQPPYPPGGGYGQGGYGQPPPPPRY